MNHRERVNLFEVTGEQLPDEVIEVLCQAPGVRIERIVSQGHHSPPDFWYDQNENEWVVLLQGAARLNIEGQLMALSPGDSCHLPAHCRHRVEWTDPKQTTIWLAVFYG